MDRLEGRSSIARAGAETAPFQRLRHILFITDIEGVAGVTRWGQTREEGPELEAARDLCTREVNAVVSGLIERADELGLLPNFRVSIWDGHGCGGLRHEGIDSRAVIYRRRRVNDLHTLFKEALASDPPMGAVGFVGQHAMAGSNGNLCHTFSSRSVRSYRLNGREVGEIEIRALHASALGLPIVFLSGDDIACREAPACVPGILTVAVKSSTGVLEAESLPSDETHRKLHQSARQILDLDPGDESLRPARPLRRPYVLKKNRLPRFKVIPRLSPERSSDDLVEMMMWAEL